MYTSNISENREDIHFYPMKMPQQIIYGVIGFLVWSFYFILFPWTFIGLGVGLKELFLSFRKMMGGKKKSYIQVSAEGLEYRLWPCWEFRCNWDDVYCIRGNRVFGDFLYLNRAEKSGYIEFENFIGRLQIPLSNIVGWSSGGLKADLYKYAPHLFESRPSWWQRLRGKG